MRIRARLAMAFALTTLLVGCASTIAAGPSVSPPMADMPGMGTTSKGPSPMDMAPSRLVPPAAFEQAVAEPNRVTIDVHIPFEGKIAGTDLIIPYNEIAQHAGDLPADRATPLAIYCRSGNMSAIAAPELRAMGYTDIVELDGGMDAWQAGGRELLSTP